MRLATAGVRQRAGVDRNRHIAAAGRIVRISVPRDRHVQFIVISKSD